MSEFAMKCCGITCNSENLDEARSRNDLKPQKSFQAHSTTAAARKAFHSLQRPVNLSMPSQQEPLSHL